LGRMVRKTYGNSIDPPWINYNYDTQGYLTSIESDCGIGCQDTINYSYDSEGRLQYRTGVNYGSIGYVYDDAGRPKTHIWPINKGSANSVAQTTSLTYTYDKASRIAAIYPDGKPQPLAFYTYNDSGQVLTIDLENGTSTEMQYDATYGRLASLTNNEADGTTVMTSFAYTYDLDGYVMAVTRENGDEISYAYDGVGRLTDEWVKNTTGTTVYRNEFYYDAVGNRTKWIQTDNIAGCTTFEYTYNTLNQLTDRSWTGQNEEYQYDLNGNLTQKVEKVFGTTDEIWEYTWDHEDRMTKVVQKDGQGTTERTVIFAYCPACGGNRTHKIVYNGTETEENCVKWLGYETEGLNQLRLDEHWDSNGDSIISETDEWRMVRITQNGPGQINQIMKETIYEYVSNTTNTLYKTTDIYYHYNRMGVVENISNTNGNELEQFTSDAFGSWDGKNTYTTRRITGKEYDQDVKLYFFHARWYDSGSSSFYSIDPILRTRQGYQFRIPPYAITSSNPLHYVDPTGALNLPVQPNTWPNKCFARLKSVTDHMEKWPPCKDKCGVYSRFRGRCPKGIIIRLHPKKCYDIWAYGCYSNRSPCTIWITEEGCSLAETSTASTGGLQCIIAHELCHVAGVGVYSAVRYMNTCGGHSKCSNASAIDF
jgi:RHS repeat-associated protein